MKNFILSILCLFILPLKSYAFNYDIWESGISITSAKAIAKNNGIQLIVDRSSHDLTNKVLSNSMHYLSPLFNRKAVITLTFTHSSNLLYRVYITWTGLSKSDAKTLNHKIISVLKQKYGVFSRNSGKSLIIQNGKKCDGKSVGYSKIDKGSRISLSLSDCFNKLSLTYTNNSLKQIHQIESVEVNKISYSDANKL